jgi:hypothetical protein
MRRALLVAAGLIVLALIAAQLLLPGVAENRLKSDLNKQGTDAQVEIKALPAVKLLFGHADDVTIEVANLKTDEDGGGDDGDSLSDLLAQTKKTKKLDVHVKVLEDTLLRMQDVRVKKDGDKLTAVVKLNRSDVDEALPAELKLTDTEVPNGLAVSGSTDVFGEQIDAEAKIYADDDGSLVLEPSDDLLGDLVSVPIFEDPRVAVDSISARNSGDGYVVTARGHLR